MAGHVFHPGHEALHGVTVVVTGQTGASYVGRYHEQVERGVVMHDVAVHDGGSGMSLDDWLARQHKFGIKVEHKQLIVPAAEVAGIRRFAAAPD